MKAKHRHTLEAVFFVPAQGGIVFSDIEALMTALDGDVRESAASRGVLELKGSRLYFHRPHPGNEAKKYQLEELHERLVQSEVTL
jgi:hypothetical protein